MLTNVRGSHSLFHSGLEKFKRGCRPGVEGGGEGTLPYMDYIGMCRCEGYGFQAVYYRIEYITHKKIKVEYVAESAKILTNVQTFRDCALHQWNVR